MSAPTVRDFARALREMGHQKIYLSHYEDEAEARRFAALLKEEGIDATVAADARKLGREFVRKCIADSSLLIIINPKRDAEHMLFHVGNFTYSLHW